MRLAKSIRTICFLTTLAGLVTLGGCDDGGGAPKPIAIDKADAEKQGKATEDFYKNPANKPKATTPGGGQGNAPRK